MSDKTTLDARLRAAFAQRFGAAPDAVFRAPGRVNLIGEHTDYNDGFVLPCAIGFETRVAIRRTGDSVAEVLAVDLGGAEDRFALDGAIAHAEVSGWADYVRGVFELTRSRAGLAGGVQVAIAGDVPQGAGLSSSAALEVALGTALSESFGLGLDATTIARIGQQAEHDYAGCRCGIMDQLVSARARAGHALLIDCRSLAVRPVPMPPGWALMIVHSRVRRGLVDSAYNERRAQCSDAAARLGLKALRDVDSVAALERLGDDTVARRARHVVGENARTLAAAEALAAGDLQGIGQLLAASHRSLRDDFQVSVPAVDDLVGILQAAIGAQGGARMTGGGFGGCVVALMPCERAAGVQEAVLRNYRSPEGEPALVWTSRAADGAGAASYWDFQNA
jgi:galactokinase